MLSACNSAEIQEETSDLGDSILETTGENAMEDLVEEDHVPYVNGPDYLPGDTNPESTNE